VIAQACCAPARKAWACSLLVDTSGLSGGADDAGFEASSSDAPADAPADAGTDGAVWPSACDRWGGLERTAFWPTRGGCLTHAGRTTLLGPAMPRLASTVPAGEVSFSSPTIDENGTIYFGTELNTKTTLAVRPDGTVKWAQVTGNVSTAVSVGADGTLYVPAGTPGAAGIHALAGDGTEKWLAVAPDEVDSCPAIDADGTVFFGSYAVTSDAGGWALASYPDGGPRWALQLAGAGGTPAIGADGTLYMIGGQMLYALTPAGAVKWSVDLATTCSSPVLGVADTLYLTCDDGAVHAFGSDGAPRWTYKTNGTTVRGPALAADGTLYVGASDEGLHAIHPDGTRAWLFAALTAVGTPLVSGDGTVYAGGANGLLFAVSPDGTKKWSLPLKDALESQPAIGADGTLYVVSRTGILNAIGNTP